MIDRYQPGRRGPATVIPFPACWKRAWLVCLVEGEGWRGEFYGDPIDGPTVTAVGAHALVVETLNRPEVRRGLPVFPAWREPA